MKIHVYIDFDSTSQSLSITTRQPTHKLKKQSTLYLSKGFSCRCRHSENISTHIGTERARRSLPQWYVPTMYVMARSKIRQVVENCSCSLSVCGCPKIQWFLTQRLTSISHCVCVCACVRACVRACACVCVDGMNLKYALRWHIHISVCLLYTSPSPRDA